MRSKGGYRGSDFTRITEFLLFILKEMPSQIQTRAMSINQCPETVKYINIPRGDTIDGCQGNRRRYYDLCLYEVLVGLSYQIKEPQLQINVNPSIFFRRAVKIVLIYL